MKKIFISGFILCSSFIFSQVGINTETPQATLEVVASPTDLTKVDGVIAPRLSGDQLKSKDALYGTAQTGAIIYATSASPDAGVSGAKTIHVNNVGYYYFDGMIWQKIGNSSFDGDTTDDAWINDPANDMVKLGTKSDGTVRLVEAAFVAKDNGRVGIGTSDPAGPLNVASTANAAYFDRYTTASGNYSSILLRKSASNDLGTDAALADGDGIGRVAFLANNGNGFNGPGTSNVEIRANAAGPQNAGNAGGRMSFWTTAVGSTGSSQRMIINEVGNVGINTSDTPSQRLDVNGNVRFRNVPEETTLTGTDRIMVLGSDGTGKKVSVSTLQSTSVTANSGLTKTGDNIQLGGVLTQDTNIGTGTDGYNITFGGSGNMGVGNLSPTQKLDVSGNVRFRSVPNETTFETTDRVMILQNDGTGKKVPVSTLRSEIDTNTNIYTTNGTLTEDRSVFLGGNNLNFGGAGSVGIGVAAPVQKLDVGGSAKISGNLGIGIDAPTRKLDIDGTARLRSVPNGSSDDNILVIDNDGVIKKSSLPPSSSFALYDTNSNTVTRNADNTPRPLAFEGTPNKIYTDYIEKINNTTYRVKKAGVYTAEAVIQYADIPEAVDSRQGCVGTLSMGSFSLSRIGDRWIGGSGVTAITRSVILNPGAEISVSTSCNRSGSQTYKTDSGSTLFITYLPL